MTGELCAIACAFSWALSSTLLKSQTDKVNVISLAAWRTVPGLFIYLVLLFFSGRANDVLHLPLRALAFLVGSTLLGMGLGDLLYIRSMKLIGLSRAMPLTSTYPFFTLILALLFLGERLSWAIVGGAVLITGGAYLLAFPRGKIRSSAEAEGDLRGVALALVAAICWAVSTVMLRLGLEGVDVLTGRSEVLAHDGTLREGFDVAVSRGVAPLRVLAELTLPFCRLGGRAVLQKKGDIRQELAQAARALDELGGCLLKLEPVPSEVLGGQRVLVVVEKVAPTLAKYPRRSGIPAKRPI